MSDDPAIAAPASPPVLPAQAAEAPPNLPMEQRADGTLVIDLLQRTPLPPPECAPEEPDPFNPEIVVCETMPNSPRLGPLVGPVDDGFASAIPRARIKLSDTASAEANATAPGVGG